MKKLAMIILTVYSLSASASVNRDSIQILKDEVSKLRDEMGMYKSNAENIMQLKSKDLELKFEELKNDYNMRMSWLLAIVPLTILALFAAVYGAYRKTKTVIEDQLQKQFQNDKEKFVALIQQHDVELSLKKKSKILVITHHEDTFSEAFVRELLLTTGYANTEFTLTDKNIDYGQFDLIFYNNSTKKISPELVKKIIEGTSKSTMHFHYGGFVNGLEVFSNISFSNMSSQVPGNLMSLLKFQSLIVNYKP